MMASDDAHLTPYATTTPGGMDADDEEDFDDDDNDDDDDDDDDDSDISMTAVVCIRTSSRSNKIIEFISYQNNDELR